MKKNDTLMEEKFLLYIDILGFSDLVENDSNKVKEIYKKVNNLNAHKHNAFQTIIFSDTILVYNKFPTNTTHDKEYVVMYMVEFVQDLMYRGNLINLNFRAIITFGQFEHYKLENVECYYGKSLVFAYMKEKIINGIGLFIDKRIEEYNTVFKSISYNSEFNFIYLFQTILRLKKYTDEILPLSKTHLELTDEFWLLKDEIEILKKYHFELNNNSDPKIRVKYMQTYLYYRNRMPTIFDTLEKNDFAMTTINSEINWDKMLRYDE